MNTKKRSEQLSASDINASASMIRKITGPQEESGQQLCFNVKVAE